LDPADPRAALYLGLSKESLGSTTEALSLYEEAIRLERASGRPQATTLLICFRLQLVLGLKEEAERTMGRALQLAPASRDVQFEQARLYMTRGQPEAAIKAGEQALRLKGEEIQESQVRFLLIRAYQAVGKENEAARHAEAVRQLERQ
jgi:tetratricopeptide (TPR) repeat protein